MSRRKTRKTRKPSKKMRGGIPSQQQRLFEQLCINGTPEEVNAFFNEHKSDIYDFETALSNALDNKNYPVMKQLLKIGEDEGIEFAIHALPGIPMVLDDALTSQDLEAVKILYPGYNGLEEVYEYTTSDDIIRGRMNKYLYHPEEINYTIYQIAEYISSINSHVIPTRAVAELKRIANEKRAHERATVAWLASDRTNPNLLNQLPHDVSRYIGEKLGGRRKRRTRKTKKRRSHKR